MQGEDVEDKSASVNDLHAEYLFETALLCWRKLIIGDEYGEARLHLGGEQLLGLTSADIGVRVGVSSLLPLSANDFSTRRTSEAR
jgi:hypothetical protein